MENNQEYCLDFGPDDEEVYTTWGAARKLRVGYQTIVLWIERGYMKCFRTKGNTDPEHRRIPADEVRRVFREMYGVKK